MPLCSDCKLPAESGWRCNSCKRIYMKLYREKKRQSQDTTSCPTCGGSSILNQRCSKCNKEYMREYRRNNLEKVKAGQRNHYLRNAEEVKNKVKQYQKENLEKVKKRQTKYYDKNKEKIKENIKIWQSKNIDKVKEMQRISCLNRIARKKNAEGIHTIHDIRKLYDIQNGLCNFCEADLIYGYHIDHIMPLSKGGSNWPENLQLLCMSCNLKKSAMTMDEFIKRQIG